MHLDLTKGHGFCVNHDDGCGGSCCTTIFYNLLEDMDSGDNILNDLKTLFLWDVRLQKHHREMKFMIHEHSGIPLLEDKVVTISLMMSHICIIVYVDVSVEGQGFE